MVGVGECICFGVVGLIEVPCKFIFISGATLLGRDIVHETLVNKSAITIINTKIDLICIPQSF